MTKKKTKTLIIVGAILSVIIISLVIMIIKTNNDLKQINSLVIENVDLSDVEDGTYYGSYSTMMVSVELNVTVTDHTITAIDIIRHDSGKGGAAEAIINDVIDSNSIEVDTVAGATYSSKVILKAIQNALTAAKS